MNEKEDSYKKFKSPIPPHLTPEERIEWEKELEWQKKEVERRKKEGMYPKYKRKRSIFGSLFRKIKIL